MEAQTENVQEISKTIGLTNKRVISRAMEYLRLLKVKSNFKGTRNEYPKIVLCLDVSATQANEKFNFDKARTLTKYGKTKYHNEKNTILSILELAKTPNIKSICNALELTRSKDVEKKATQILTKLKKSKENLLGEVGHPQNHSMAVYYSCELLSVKVDEKKLITLSRLQRRQWTQLKILWRPFLDDRVNVLSAKVTKKTSKNVTPTQKNVADNLTRPPNPPPVVKSEPIESYHVWKKRILAKAYADLAILKRNARRCTKRTKK